MLALAKKGVKWKLSMGFVLCAAIAGISGIAGIFFLSQIQSDMARTTAEVGSNIDNQVSLTTHMLPLRTSAFSIISASTINELEDIKTRLDNHKKNNLSNSKIGDTLHHSVVELLNFKRKKLITLDELSELSKSTRTKLDGVIKQSISIVDDVEFDSEMKIIDAITGIEENIGKSKDSASIKGFVDEISSTTSTAVATIKAALNLRSLSNELKSMVNDAIASIDKEHVDYTKIQITTLLGNTKNELAILPPNDNTQQISNLLDELRGIIDLTITAKNKTLVADRELADTTSSFWEQMNSLEIKMLAEAKDMKNNADTSLEKSTSIVRQWQTIELFLVIGSLILAIILGIYISSFIIQPLKRTVAMLEDIAVGEGDLTARMKVESRDEIGELAKWFNLFIVKLQKMIREISTDAKLLSESSLNLSSLSSHMVSASELVTSQSTEAAIATEEMSSNINSIASATEEMSVNVQNVSSTAEEMSQNVDSVAESIEETSNELSGVARYTREGSEIAAKAMDESNSAMETIHDLGRAAKDIGDVTALITRIAQQTNLLALNATIEAASAGDAGKGFAVVANEIKELAQQSAQAAQSISSRIQGIQTNTSKVVKVIGDVSNIINNINESSSLILQSVEHQQNTAAEISGNVVQARTGTNNIATSIAEVASGSNDMAKAAANAADGIKGVFQNIQSVNTAAKQSSAGAIKVDLASHELEEIASKIQTLVDRFKT